MKTMYQVSARYDKWLEKGITKVNETYLVDARSVTEAEARALEYLKPYVHQSELEIVKVVEIKYQELIEQGESYYYKAKIEMTTIDNNGKEVKVKHTLLVNGESLEHAMSALIKMREDSLADVRLVSIAESPILEVIRA